MTTVTFSRRNGHYQGFSCKGHAGYAESGSDIVCSAISALTQTAVLGLEEVAKIPADISIHDGNLRWFINTDVSDEQRKAVDLLLDTLQAGLHAVDESYPGYLKFCSKEV